MKIVDMVMAWLLFAALLIFEYSFISIALQRVIGNDADLLGQMSAAIIFQGLFSMAGFFLILIILIRIKK